MLLSPEHFQWQDARTDEVLGWILRHCIDGHGLAGGGVRAGRALRGLAGLDPRLEVRDEGSELHVGVLQARGLTPGGEIVDVTPDASVSLTVSRGELSGLTAVRVYVVRDESTEEDPASLGLDPGNPNQAAFRRPAYRLELGARVESRARSLCVGQIVRSGQTVGFEQDPHFIPACYAMQSHSRLFAAWQAQQAELSLLAGQYAELHRRISAWVEKASLRGVDTRPDTGVREFVERAVLALDECAYDTLDSAMAPPRFLAAIDRAGRRTALALDLSTATRDYFQMLSDADAGYGSLLLEERGALAGSPDVQVGENLADGITRAGNTLQRLRRLVEALEAKYVDFRISRSIEALRFLLDADGEQFFLAVASPGHPQREGDLLTFAFSQLSLAGQQRYRLVLLGDPDGVSTWQPGEEFRVDIRVNPASGVSRPISKPVQCHIAGQRNFSADFDTPREVAAINTLNVTVQPGQRVRGAILYQRRLGIGGDAYAPPPPQPDVYPPKPGPAPQRAPNGAEAARQPIIVKKRIRTDDE